MAALKRAAAHLDANPNVGSLPQNEAKLTLMMRIRDPKSHPKALPRPKRVARWLDNDGTKVKNENTSEWSDVDLRAKCGELGYKSTGVDRKVMISWINEDHDVVPQLTRGRKSKSSSSAAGGKGGAGGGGSGGSSVPEVTAPPYAAVPTAAPPNGSNEQTKRKGRPSGKSSVVIIHRGRSGVVYGSLLRAAQDQDRFSGLVDEKSGKPVSTVVSIVVYLDEKGHEHVTVAGPASKGVLSDALKVLHRSFQGSPDSVSDEVHQKTAEATSLKWFGSEHQVRQNYEPEKPRAIKPDATAAGAASPALPASPGSTRSLGGEFEDEERAEEGPSPPACPHLLGGA